MFGNVAWKKSLHAINTGKTNAFTNYSLFRAQEQNSNAPGNLSDTFPVGRQQSLGSVSVYFVGRRVRDHVFSEIICKNVF